MIRKVFWVLVVCFCFCGEVVWFCFGFLYFDILGVKKLFDLRKFFLIVVRE